MLQGPGHQKKHSQDQRYARAPEQFKREFVGNSRNGLASRANIEQA